MFMFSQSDVEIVQQYWFSIAPNGDDIAASFYQDLFEKFPEYRKYFTSDREAQQEKLIRMINIVINGVTVWEVIRPEIVKLGQFHAEIADFGKKDYQNIVNTLLGVMERYRGIPDERATEAWLNLFALISDTMMQAADEFSSKNKITF